MFEQYEASRTVRFTQTLAISRTVSSLTEEQFDISRDSKSGHDIAADRIAASESLWQEAISRSRRSGQLRTACGILLRFRDKVSSRGHLKNTAIQKIFAQFVEILEYNYIIKHISSPDRNTKHAALHYLKIVQSIVKNWYLLDSITQSGIIDSQTLQWVAICYR